LPTRHGACSRVSDHLGLYLAQSWDTRLLHRITVAGDIPVGIGGDTSAVRKGGASSCSSLAAA
jgi:hypothetical protein